MGTVQFKCVAVSVLLLLLTTFHRKKNKMRAVKSKLSALHQKHAEAVKAAEECEAELADINSNAEALEQMAEVKTAELNEIEDQLDAAESKLQEFISNLGASEKSGEEGLQAKKQLENRAQNDSKFAGDLQTELDDLNAKNEEVVEKLATLLADLQECEEKLDLEDERVETHDIRVKQLEVEVTLVGNSLRSMEICEKEGNERVSHSDNKMVSWENRYKEKDEEATVNEARSAELEEQSDAKDEELNQARAQYDATKVEFDALIAEIAEI